MADWSAENHPRDEKGRFVTFGSALNAWKEHHSSGRVLTGGLHASTLAAFRNAKREDIHSARRAGAFAWNEKKVASEFASVKEPKKIGTLLKKAKQSEKFQKRARNGESFSLLDRDLPKDETLPKAQKEAKKKPSKTVEVREVQLWDESRNIGPTPNWKREPSVFKSKEKSTPSSNTPPRLATIVEGKFTRPGEKKAPLATRVQNIFDHLDAKAGGNNQVLLYDLRREVGASRTEFDACIDRLRRDGVLTLSPEEGRFGRLPTEKVEAGIEGPSGRLVYAARRDPSTAGRRKT